MNPNPRLPARLGLTGSRRFDPELHADQVAAFFEGLIGAYDIKEVTSGGCRGFDEFGGAWWFHRLPEALHRVVLPAADHDIFGQMRPWWPEGQVRVEQMPDGSGPRDRNTSIVGHSSVLAAVPVGPIDVGRSGTRMTWNIARRAGIELALCQLT